MEINTQKKNEQITALKNAEIISKFSDGKFLFKIAGENVWYLVDSNGNTIPRTRPDGTEEFSTIDFYEMSGNPYYFELGQFKEGFIVAKLLSEKNRYFLIDILRESLYVKSYCCYIGQRWSWKNYGLCLSWTKSCQKELSRVCA